MKYLFVVLLGSLIILSVSVYTFNASNSFIGFIDTKNEEVLKKEVGIKKILREKYPQDTFLEAGNLIAVGKKDALFEIIRPTGAGNNYVIIDTSKYTLEYIQGHTIRTTNSILFVQDKQILKYTPLNGLEVTKKVSNSEHTFDSRKSDILIVPAYTETASDFIFDILDAKNGEKVSEFIFSK